MNKLVDKYYQFHRIQMAKKLSESGAKLCFVPAPVRSQDKKVS
jgi:hypothetical protein